MIFFVLNWFLSLPSRTFYCVLLALWPFFYWLDSYIGIPSPLELVAYGQRDPRLHYILEILRQVVLLVAILLPLVYVFLRCAQFRHPSAYRAFAWLHKLFGFPVLTKKTVEPVKTD